MGLSSAVPDANVSSLILGLGIPGTCLTFFVLCAYAFAAWHPVSKHHLNRVSFRLLVYALIANLIFGTFLIGTQAIGPSTHCSFLGFLINLSLMFSAGMFFCMALNLQLTLVHTINGQKMERYYIFGTLIVCLLCHIAAYASGQFGWNDISEICSFWNADQEVMLRWLIGTQLFWVLLMSTGEIVVFVVIVGHIVSYELVTQTYRQKTEDTMEVELQYSIPLESPISMYRNVILRIGLYPLVSFLMNFSSCVIDLYLVKNPVQTVLNRQLWVAIATKDLAIYSSRPLVYGLLALTDPSFVRAIMAIRRPVKTRPLQQSLGFQFAVHTTNVVHLELQSVDSSRKDKHDGADFNWTSVHTRGGYTVENQGQGDSSKPPPLRRSLSDLHNRKGSTANVGCQF
ncbi:hypothetical protein MVEN_01852500 [Mycena venus]|uniref:Uncharacterized protein n=1 Tax=Mycena venus TaxID=2733690 RepID=A0A8H6XIL5_9AGAR|nr:hypothetical protein MVEN_01852500 [Mycena venus]